MVDSSLNCRVSFSFGLNMRKQILKNNPAAHSVPAPSSAGELDVAAIATAIVSSESPEHPIENAFDALRGPGATRWVAETPGEQTLILAFDQPQSIRRVDLEIEESQTARTQELQLSISVDGGQTYRELVRQEYNFSPPDTTFEREEWSFQADGVTHLRLWIKPDKGNRAGQASLTALTLR